MTSLFFCKGPWEDDDEIPNDSSSTSGQQAELTDTQKHQLRHRELFLTRQNETLLATNIRGKCLVTLHNETETFLSYVNSEVGVFLSKEFQNVHINVHRTSFFINWFMIQIKKV